MVMSLTTMCQSTVLEHALKIPERLSVRSRLAHILGNSLPLLGAQMVYRYISCPRNNLIRQYPTTDLSTFKLSQMGDSGDNCDKGLHIDFDASRVLDESVADRSVPCALDVPRFEASGLDGRSGAQDLAVDPGATPNPRTKEVQQVPLRHSQHSEQWPQGPRSSGVTSG